MKQFRVLLLFTLTLVAVAPAALAVDFGVRAGRYDFGEDGGNENIVGAELAIDFGRVTLNPNIEYFYDIEDATVASGNLDLTFDIGQFGIFAPYLGAGVGLGYVDSDFGDDTSLLGNAIGGVRFDLAFLKPYGQVKLVHDFDEGGGNDWVLAVGLRF